MHSDSLKRRFSFLVALLLTAGDLRRQNPNKKKMNYDKTILNKLDAMVDEILLEKSHVIQQYQRKLKLEIKMTLGLIL